MTDPTPTRDEAVARIMDDLRPYAGKTLGSIRIGVDEVKSLVDWFDASAPAPASGGVDAVAEACAQAAEGPEYWPHPKQPGDVLTYRGTKDGNWLAVKPPFKLDPYSQGRADAAAAVRALSPTPVSEAGGEPVGWTGPGSLDALKKGEHGTLYPKPPTPLATPLYLAKPASSPAGGDVREALAFVGELEALAFSKQMSQRPLDYEQVQTIFKAVSAIRAALSPSTSAAEPVAWRVDIPSFGPAFFTDRRDAERQCSEPGCEGSTLHEMFDHPALAAERRTGLIKWHSSEEDGGPDCGMELDIGTGRSLYLGELAGHDDWQVAIIERDTITPIADVHDRATAQILIEAIAAATRAQGE